MATVQELRAEAQIIHDERQIGGNTAKRIGDTFMTAADVIEQLGEESHAAVESAQAAAESAEASQQASDESAESAASSAASSSAAQESAATAEAQATTAQQSAASAADSAATAESAATEATAEAVNASASASAAQDSAAASAASASQAQKSAASAAGDAERAVSEAQAATSIANAADEKAMDALTRAGNAETAAQQAAVSAQNSEAYAQQAAGSAASAESEAQAAGTAATQAQQQATAAATSAAAAEQGAIYDISVLHPTSGVGGGNTYASLSAALAVIPQNKHKGGMTVRYIQGSDNKFVQYRLMSDTFNTTPANWQGVDEEPTAGSDNLVKSGGVYHQISSKTVESMLSLDKKYNIQFVQHRCIKQDGSYSSDGISDNVWATIDYIPVKAGQRLYLYIYAPGSIDVCAWYNADYSFRSFFQMAPRTEADRIVTAPADGFLRVSNEYPTINNPYIQLIDDSFKSNKELEQADSALGERIDKTESDINTLWNRIDKKLQGLVFERNICINTSGGITTGMSDDVYGTRDYIPVHGVSRLYLMLYAPGTTDVCAWYDENKNFIPPSFKVDNTSTNPRIVNVPANACYLRVSNEIATVTNPYIQLIDDSFKSIDELSEEIVAEQVKISQNKEDIEQLYLHVDKKLRITWEKNIFITTDGSVYTGQGDNNYATREYISVYGISQLYLMLYCPGWRDVCAWYDEDKVLISPTFTVSNESQRTVTVPDGAYYLRVSNDTTGVPNPYVQIIDDSFKSIDDLEGEIEDLDEKIDSIEVSGAVKPFYVEDIDKYDTDTDVSKMETFRPKQLVVEHKYIGQVTPEKRFMSISFDDWRATDFNTYMPLFEKYGFKATFNQPRTSDTPTETELGYMSNLIYGGHELGDHSWKHYGFPFTEPLFNGQDPSNLDGNQAPFPTNEQMRGDRGDGKNVFGITLTTIVTTPNLSTQWGQLTDAQCQIIRNYFSVLKDTDSNLIVLFDALSNKYLGTTGSSNGSWDNVQGCYTGGIFTGCKTSANHEIWERILSITELHYKAMYGLNYKIKTWSLPGTKLSSCYFSDGTRQYYDSACTKLANYLAKFESSTLTNEDGSYKNRSWVDCLREFGYSVTPDTIWPGRLDGTPARLSAMARQFVFNSKGRKVDALPFSSNMTKNFSHATVKNAWVETDMQGTKSLAAQMYDSTKSSVFKDFIEAARKNMSNGIIDVETTDSENTYSMRLFYEGLLKYCKVTGVELLTEQEAYDVCFNHKVEYGNLIYNPTLRNTAKEFMPDAETIPTNPDGYDGNCSVVYDTDNTPVLVTSGTVVYAHYGIPNGNIVFKASIKGTGTVTIKSIKNNSERSLSSLSSLTSQSVNDNNEFTEFSLSFNIPDNAIEAYDEYEGLGNKIIGIVIEYSSGLQVKDMDLRKV